MVSTMGMKLSVGTGSGKMGVAGKIFTSLFLMFFLSLGLVVTGLLVRDVWKDAKTYFWPAVPCTIVLSEVRSHSGDDGLTYSVDILYRYKINGKEYQSNRYKFLGGSSSGSEGKQQIVNRHKPGTKMVCYVDPSDPTQAVLERGFTADLLFGLIPLVFVVIGGGGLMYMRREKPDKVRAGKVASRKWLPKVKGRPVEVRGATKGTVPVVLKPAGGPGIKLLITMAMAGFWNGIVSVFVVKMVGGWARGKPDMCLTVFLIPFEVIGVVMLGAVVYCGLAFFNPRLTMVVSRASVRLGDALTVAWQIGGRHERIVRLRLWLIGREEATYQRGTSTTTDKSVFAKIPIVDASKAEEIRQGKAIAQIPRDTMHSFDAPNNKIVWVIAAEGEIPRWPDIGQEYRIVVFPAGASEETRP